MIKEELDSVKDICVGKKMLEIINNSYQAVLKKELAETKIQYDIRYTWTILNSSQLQSWEWIQPETFSVGKYYCKINFTLEDWAYAYIKLDYEMQENAKKLRKLLTVEQYHGTKRVIAFKDICEDEKLEYDIWYNVPRVYKNTTEQIMKIGKGIVTLTGTGMTSRYLLYDMFFSNGNPHETYQMRFRVFIRDCEEFIQILTGYVLNCKLKKITTKEGFESEMKNSLLYEYKYKRKGVKIQKVEEEKIGY